MSFKGGITMKEIVSPPDRYRTLTSRGSQWQPDEFNEKKVLRIVDRRILPILCSVYFLQFMDKIILNYAKVMNLEEDLHMDSDDFPWAGTAFFIGYMVAELPQGVLPRHLA
jgi:MFS transporter, ACS family, allantoate permease